MNVVYCPLGFDVLKQHYLNRVYCRCEFFEVFNDSGALLTQYVNVWSTDFLVCVGVVDLSAVKITALLTYVMLHLGFKET